jgi:hypothetical protein
MKRTYTILLLILINFPLASIAQSLKHSILVSTSLSFKKDETQYVDMTTVTDYTQTLNIKSKVGYFIFSRLAVGVYVPYQSQFHKYNHMIESRYKKFGVGPFARYYQPVYKRKLYTILDCGVVRNWESGLNDDGSFKQQFTSTVLGAGLGYFLKKNIAVEAIVDSTEDLKDDSGNGPYVYTSQLNLNFGFVIYFGKNL